MSRTVGEARAICRRHGLDIRAMDSNLFRIAEALEALEERGKQNADRLALLDRWLEVRGLPAGWAGDLDAWGFVVFGRDGVLGAVAAQHENAVERMAEYEACRLFPGHSRIVRWDRAIPAQKAEALRIESLRVEREAGDEPR